MSRTETLWILATLALAGCGELRSVPSSSPLPANATLSAQPAPESLRSVLIMWGRDRQWEAGERTREILRLQNLPAPDPATRLRLAHLLFQQPGAEDHARARQLLDALAQDASAEALALAPLVALLRENWNAQAELETLKQQLTQQLQEAQTRADALNTKIQELKAIERNLVSRPAPEPKR